MIAANRSTTPGAFERVGVGHLQSVSIGAVASRQALTQGRLPRRERTRHACQPLLDRGEVVTTPRVRQLVTQHRVRVERQLERSSIVVQDVEEMEAKPRDPLHRVEVERLADGERGRVFLIEAREDGPMERELTLAGGPFVVSQTVRMSRYPEGGHVLGERARPPAPPVRPERAERSGHDGSLPLYTERWNVRHSRSRCSRSIR